MSDRILVQSPVAPIALDLYSIRLSHPGILPDMGIPGMDYLVYQPAGLILGPSIVRAYGVRQSLSFLVRPLSGKRLKRLKVLRKMGIVLNRHLFRSSECTPAIQCPWMMSGGFIAL